MFAVIYHDYVKPNQELRIYEILAFVATYFLEYRRSLASYLYKAEDGLWIAYLRWLKKKYPALLGHMGAY